MKLESVRIQNFRSFKDETIFFDNYTCLVGPNGGGKSNVLTAMNVFFRNTASSATDVTMLTKRDFHFERVESPISITLTFTNLSEKAKEDFKAYCRHGKLIVSSIAEWNDATQGAEVKQFGERMVMKDFKPYFKLEQDGAKVTELRAKYAEIRSTFNDVLDVSTKADMTNALRQYEEMHVDVCTQERSEDQFYGWSRGVNRLKEHVEWMYVPAVKHASEEQDESKNTVLGQLLQRRIRSEIDFSESLESLKERAENDYQSLLCERQSALSKIRNALEIRLREWSHPGSTLDLNWYYDPNKSVVIQEPYARVLIGEREFLGEIARLGHGMQRSFIIALLQELAVLGAEGGPGLLLGIEEPELYQHPPQARHFARLLEDLSEGNAQAVATTHSPYFISGKGFEAVRMVRPRDGTGDTMVSQLKFDKLAADLEAALDDVPQSPSVVMAAVEQILQPSQSELFFATVPILVEGQEDVAVIATHFRLTNTWDDFRKYGCHFVVCGGKTTMSRPLAIANGLSIRAFTVFDADGAAMDLAVKADNERDNKCILNLCEADAQHCFPTEVYWGQNFVVWPDKILSTFRQDVGDDAWSVACESVRNSYGLSAPGVSMKNPMLLAAVIEKLWNQEKRSGNLKELCRRIITFASGAA
jgi:putative ATP-dependent endonuclease of OLD family